MIQYMKTIYVDKNGVITRKEVKNQRIIKREQMAENIIENGIAIKKIYTVCVVETLNAKPQTLF